MIERGYVAGVVVVGHGTTATVLLSAANAILGSDALADVRAIDAGAGETEELRMRICDAIEDVDGGAGVLLIVDLVGASPFHCARQEGREHRLVTVGGLNLAMLLKLGALDRAVLDADRLASMLAESGRRAMTVTIAERTDT